MPKQLHQIFSGTIDDLRNKFANMSTFALRKFKDGQYNMVDRNGELKVAYIDTKWPALKFAKFKFMRIHVEETIVGIYHPTYSLIDISHIIIFSHGLIIFAEKIYHEPRFHHKYNLSDAVVKMIAETFHENFIFTHTPQKFAAIMFNGIKITITTALKLILIGKKIVLEDDKIILEKDDRRQKYIYQLHLPRNKIISGCELRAEITTRCYPQKISVTYENEIVIFTRIK